MSVKSTCVLASLVGAGFLTMPGLSMANVVTQSSSITMDSPILESQVEPVVFNQTQFEKLPEDQQEHIAKIWGISSSEYSQYLWEMGNTPSGQWYKQLDPAEVLMINASDDNQRMKYAKIVAQNAHDRGDKEIAAQVAYSRAWQILYPNLPRVRIPEENAFQMPTLESGDLIVYFTSADSMPDNSALQALLRIIEKQPGVKLKIYMEGNPSLSGVETWANKQNLPRDLYQKGLISMEIDRSGYFDQLTHGDRNLPFAALDTKGSLKPVPMDQLWMWQEQ